MKLRYQGEFLSVKDILYTVRIWQNSDHDYDVEQLSFPDECAVIEWSGIAKHDPVMASSLLLKLFSVRDRMFIDLYAASPGSVRVEVLRNGRLYWSGILDSELYEEPYSYRDGYVVEMTFSDLAFLDRLKYSPEEPVSVVGKVIQRCLDAAGISSDGMEQHISTTRIHSLDVLQYDSVQNDNFADSDGEPFSIREVLEAVLQPYDLHVVQKAGKWHLWDWNSLYHLPHKDVVWDSDDAYLSVDAMYSDISISFTANQTTALVGGSIEVEDGERFTVRCNLKSMQFLWTSPEGYEITLGDGSENDYAVISSDARLFSIRPVYSGEDATGIAWLFKHIRTPGGKYENILGNTVTSAFGKELFRLKKKPFVIPGDGFIRVTMQLLADVRYNPFEPDGLYNEEGNWKDFQNMANHAFVPVIINLIGYDDQAWYHIDNSRIIDAEHKDDPLYALAMPEWKSGPGKFGDAVLCYYNSSDRRSKSGLGGWAVNRKGAGYYRDELPSLYGRLDDGEYLPMPPVAGRLEVIIGTGLLIWDFNAEVPDKIYPMLNHLLYKLPELTICDKYGRDIDTADIEYRAWLSDTAREELQINTCIGTLGKYAPFARGQILDNYDNPTLDYIRNGITAPLEDLLCGTLYSQYAVPHNVLKGTASLCDEFGIYADNNTDGKFAVTSETQNLCYDTSDLQLTEVTQDQYMPDEQI